MPVKRKTRKPRGRKPTVVLVPVPMRGQQGGNFFRSLARGLSAPFRAIDSKILKPIGVRPTEIANLALDFAPLGGVVKSSARLVTKGLKKKGLGKRKKAKTQPRRRKKK